MIRESRIGLLAAFLAVACAPAIDPPERIVLVVVDTLRVDHVGAFGGPVETPTLDALAARGQKLSALAAYHQTSMSMGALFTGRTPSLEGPDGEALPWTQGTFCGMARFRARGDPCLPGGPGTLAEDLRQLGYETLAVTSNPLLFRPYGYDRGFEVWREVGDLPPDPARRLSRREHAQSRTGDRVHAAVQQVLAERRTDRFFLYVHYLDVHDWILQKHAYRKGVAAFDAHLARLLEALDEGGLLEGSLVVVTADHGESLSADTHPVKSPLHTGNPSYDTVLRVPLIAAPAFFPAGAVVRGQDLRAHLVAVARGVPLGDAGQDPELFLTELRYRTYREGRFKSAWPRSGDAPLLFDLEVDPDETRDVAAEHPAVLERHRDRVAELSGQLRARNEPMTALDAEAEERLRVLGYLE